VAHYCCAFYKKLDLLIPKYRQALRVLPMSFGMLEHFKFALKVVFFVRHEYFFHPKSGNLQEVS
jgi:hypothetical protein